MTKATLTARHGTRWFEQDVDEIAKTEARKRGRCTYGLYLFLIAASAIATLIVAPPACTTTPAIFLEGAWPPWALASFRSASAILCFSTLVVRCLQTQGADEETLDGRPIHLISHGIWRLQGLTQWQFACVTIYFSLSASITVAKIVSGKDAVPLATLSALACFTETMLGIAFALAMLTSVIVTYVLIPKKIKSGVSVAQFFTFNDLVMHNANSALLVVDILAGALSINIGDMPYVLLIGVVYTTYHHYIRYPHTRTLLYQFLNWQHPLAAVILLALLAAIGLFFAFGAYVSETLRQATPWGPVAVLGLQLLVMRVRDPTPTHAADAYTELR